MKKERPFIPAHGNYKDLLSYRKSEIVYDITYRFCGRFLSDRDRTVDQMIQAARSGKQNIVESSKASGTSKETEIRLLGVARASLEELLTDFCDFLRVRNLMIWHKESREAKFIRRLGSDLNATYIHYRGYCETRSAHVVANIAICTIHQTNYLLDRQLRALERDFVLDGGLKERMATARRKQRNQSSPE
jgi:four helix bundle suffix protein